MGSEQTLFRFKAAHRVLVQQWKLASKKRRLYKDDRPSGNNAGIVNSKHVQDPVVLINSEMAERKRHADAMMKCWRVWNGAGALTHAVPVCVVISLKQQGNRVNTTLPLICWWPDTAHIMNQMCYGYGYTDIGPHLRPLSHTQKCQNVITLDT